VTEHARNSHRKYEHDSGAHVHAEFRAKCISEIPGVNESRLLAYDNEGHAGNGPRRSDMERERLRPPD